MRSFHPYFLAALVAVLIATPVQALHSPSNTNLEEINHHQAGASAALIMGDHTYLEPGRVAASGHIHLSGWTTDSLYGAWGLSFQAGVGRNFGVGLSYGFTDAQLRTRTLLANVQYSLASGPNPWLHFQASVGYQFLDSSESENVLIFEFDDPWPIRPGNPQILLDDMNWANGYLNVVVDPQYWKLRPQASLGYIFSHYSWSGWEVPTFGGLDAGLGPALSDSGNTGSTIFTLGLGLDLDPVRPYVGVETFNGGGLFLARMTILFK